jgi:hypothetical protein
MESSEDKLSSLPGRVYAQGKNVKRLSIGRDNQPVSYIQANGKAQTSPDRPLSADPVRALPTSGSGVHRRSLTTNNTTGSGSGLGSGSGHLAHAHANSHTNQYLDSPRYETDLASPNSPNNYARRVQDWRAVGSPRRASYAPGSASFSAQSPLFGPSPIDTFSLRNGFGSNGQGITNPPPGFGSPLDKSPQHQPLQQQQQQQQPLPIFQYYRGREHGTRSFSLSLKPQDGDDQDDYFLSSPLRQAVHNHNSGSQQNRNGSISSNRHAQNNYDFDQDGEIDEEDALESKSWARRMTSYSPSPYNTSGVNSSNNSRRLQQQQQHQHHHNQNNLDQHHQQQQWNFRRQSYSIGAPTSLPPLPKPVQSTSTSSADYSLVDSKMKDLSLNFQLDTVPSGFMENYGNLFDNTTLGKDNPKLRMYVSNNPVDTTSVSREVSYIVEFKRGRTDVFHCNNNKTATATTGGEGTKYKEGDLVIVEADRGEDLGKITAIIDTDTAYTSATTTTNKKLILRPASRSECNMLLDKHRDELKALSICQTKIRQKRLDEIMEVLDAEYQWDRKRLTFFYLSEDRIDFRDLVKDLFKIYKTRIWMCSVDRQSQQQQQ